ncbi:MAG: GNAT family N-acetyltransferase, partial [Chitinispirillaceae bacterium]
ICGLLKQIIDGIKEVEVSYRLLDKYWGRGYGTEAALGCMQYARDVLHKSSVISLIREVNKPSIRVAEKNGLTVEKEALFCGLQHLVYRKRFE